MKPTFKSDSPWMLAFALKALACIGALGLAIFLVLWILGALYLFTLILAYEGFFTAFLGVLQILSSFIYRENSVAHRWGGARTGWFDFRRFSKMKQEERQKYRLEGVVLTLIGFLTVFISLLASAL